MKLTLKDIDNAINEAEHLSKRFEKDVHICQSECPFNEFNPQELSDFFEDYYEYIKTNDKKALYDLCFAADIKKCSLSNNIRADIYREVKKEFNENKYISETEVNEILETSDKYRKRCRQKKA